MHYHALFLSMEVNFLNTFSKKLSYIWDYYKLYIIGIPCVLLLLAYVITTFTKSKDFPFSIYFINQEVSIENCVLLEEALTQKMGETDIDSSLYINPAAPDADSQIAFTTAISGHTIDIMISDTLFLEHYSKKEVFADLETLLPANLYQALSQSIIFVPDKEGVMQAYAIDLSSCTYFAKLNLENPVLTIAKYSEHKDSCIALLSLLFSL